MDVKIEWFRIVRLDRYQGIAFHLIYFSFFFFGKNSLLSHCQRNDKICKFNQWNYESIWYNIWFWKQVWIITCAEWAKIVWLQSFKPLHIEFCCWFPLQETNKRMKNLKKCFFFSFSFPMNKNDLEIQFGRILCIQRSITIKLIFISLQFSKKNQNYSLKFYVRKMFENPIEFSIQNSNFIVFGSIIPPLMGYGLCVM